MKESGETPRDLAAHLNISYVYLMSLARGERPIEKVDKQIYADAAEYLNLAIAQVMLLAGHLEAKDLIIRSEKEFKIQNVLNQITNDHEWFGFAPRKEQLNALSEELKIFIGLLYQRASQTSGLTDVVVSPSEI